MPQSESTLPLPNEGAAEDLPFASGVPVREQAKHDPADDAAYFRARAEDEQEAAATSSCMVKDVHLDLAEMYTAQADMQEGGMPPADDR